MDDVVEPQVVQAVGIATSHSIKPDLRSRLEEAMTQAVIDFQAEGVTDIEEQRRRILEARDRVLAG